MTKFSIDYDEISNVVDRKFYKLSELSDRLEKVAFDIYKDKTTDELWQVQNSDDGDYIVARYDSDESKVEKTAASKSNWSVAVYNSDTIGISYLGLPINKFAASQLGINKEDFKFVIKTLPNKLSSDKPFVRALLNTVDKSIRDNILKLHPELL